ncbi:MAG TPA: IclR family transcriptional regulator [Burkholderiaceae bacterium]|jgi:DNA-binding IclR family transcriptional regulator|nr:IclR family transcriptional regulator [Burkholderiaceae bacterium]
MPVSDFGDGAQSVARALHMLEALAAAPSSLGVRELARAVGVAPSTAQRIVCALAERGFIEQDAARKYRIGLRAFAVGNAFRSGSTLVRAAMEELQSLADHHQLNAYLGIREGASVLYLLSVQSSGPIVIKGAPGSRTFLHTTALGKVMLASLADDEIKSLLGPQPYRHLTPATITRLSPLMAEIRAVRKSGYAVSDEENLPGVYAIGAAIRDASGATVAAISGALPRQMVDRRTLTKIIRPVRDAADRISAQLGAHPALGRKPGEHAKDIRAKETAWN